MDKVRFGRALGKGARGAAKTVWEAADAAMAPGPGSSADEQPRATTTAGPQPSNEKRAARGTPNFVAQARMSDVGRTAKAAGASVLAPVKRFSSVLWLEVTGSFFALVALFLANGAWMQRGAAHGGVGAAAERKFWVDTVGFAVFAYFAVSSFVRARRRGKRAA